MLVHFHENAVLYSVSKYYIHPKTEVFMVIRFQTEDLIVFVLLIVICFQNNLGTLVLGDCLTDVSNFYSD